jgi:hypothetical protein
MFSEKCIIRLKGINKEMLENICNNDKQPRKQYQSSFRLLKYDEILTKKNVNLIEKIRRNPLNFKTFCIKIH